MHRLSHAARRRFRVLRREGGFTLVEMLVAIAVLGLILSGIASLLQATVTASGQTMNETPLQMEARSALDTMVGDLREAYYGDTTTSVIVSMSGTSVTFYAPDRLTPFHLREITYQLSGSKLQRGFVTSTNTGGPAWTVLAAPSTFSNIVPNVTNFSLTYQDANGNTTATPANVVRVLITLTVTAAPQGGPTTFTASATIREG